MFNPEYLQAEIPEIFTIAKQTRSVDELRHRLSQLAHQMEFDTADAYEAYSEGSIIRVRDCARVLYRILSRRSVDKAQFSVAQAIHDLAWNRSRPDLRPAFYAELLYLFRGLQGRGSGRALDDLHLIPSRYKKRQAARHRSKQLDKLDDEVRLRLRKSVSGLDPQAIERREKRRRRILAALNASQKNWYDWRWQVENIMRAAAGVAACTVLSDTERRAMEAVKSHGLPFGITPYYLSLMDDTPETGRDRAIRAQVIPPFSYIDQMATQDRNSACLDFMREADTSPIDLITRRYPAICIFKPFNTCPQICVYCQRNWEIEDAMQPGAMATVENMDAALDWIKQHPAIHEVLITGGDPLAMADEDVDRILQGVARIPTVERIRIGTRILVTMPMRITDQLADILVKYRAPGQRQVAVVTHVQHPYEIGPDTVEAVNKLRARGISIYNQLVYTFFVSRRFEAAHLRKLLALIGVDPYYTFNTKGKGETVEYRVPIARLLQEQKEEARLLPGLARTDEAVYNVPGLGKNYLRARQHRDLISILPDGSRLYEFHPWEKNISRMVTTHISEDIPILDYLQRLEAIGEDASDYETIWYYF
ncbi:MAG: KamA family radical SAM protein [Desulfobacterales bacterium]|nr:MAG: KamA family radical SAM protein [Desulfobacterales bacterium]